MKKKAKPFFVLFIAALCFIYISACSNESKQEAVFDSFKEKLLDQDYEGLYELLSADAQNYITEEDFVKKYSNIYSGIQATNMSIEKWEVNAETATIPFSLTMDTIAGEINEDYQLQLVKEDDAYKINWDESLIFPNMEKRDKVKINTDTAARGKILDRNGKVLAEDGVISEVGINPEIFDLSNREEKINELAETLDISAENITKKLEANENPSHFVPIVDILSSDEKLGTLRERNNDGIFIYDKNSRIYINNEAFGRLLGYVGVISAEELEKSEEKGYNDTSLIGKAGLEQVYEETLRGIDGAEIYIERQEEKVETIAKKAAQDGEDIKLTIDSDLQEKIYSEMNGEKGSASAVDPKTGEVLALVSSPSYNSNRYTTYVTKTEQEKREASDYADEENRFSKLYSPGSTFKLITATAGLENGTIDPNEEITIDGKSWQKDSSWGNYKVTRVNSQTSVDLKTAIKYSDNIYFAMSALDMGSDALINGAKRFGIGEELDIGYPFNNSQMSNDGTIDDGIQLADSGYGQGEVMVTTLNMALAYSALSNNGNIMSPSLVVTDNQETEVWKEAAIPSDYLSILQNDFSAVINEDGGTANDAKISGIQLAGKTGTAEIKASQDDEDGTENGWFVATDLDSSKISIAMVLDDVKGKGGSHAVSPIVKNILSSYLK